MKKHRKVKGKQPPPRVLPTQVLMPLVKVAIRTETEWVVAYVASGDGKTREEVARIARRLLDERPDLWKRWKALTTAGGVYIIESLTGATVVGTCEMDPSLVELEDDGQGN